MKSHAACQLFPLLNEKELADLAEDIEKHGLLHPIVMHGDAVLDGRNRLAACELAGIAPVFVQWVGQGSPMAFVLSTNLRRRHLNESQRALVGAEAKPLFEAEAKTRQLAAQNNDAGRAIQANLPEQEKGQARDEAARPVNVSPRSVESACQLLRGGTSELVEAVREGKVRVSNAAVVAGLPADEQRDIVARGEKEILAAAKAIRAKKSKERVSKKKSLADGIRAEPPVPPEGPFRVIAIDPPWRYNTGIEDSQLRGLSDYPDMSIEEICALPVAQLAHESCVLWLWITNAFLVDGVHRACLEAWGFTGKTVLTWDKEKLGVGHWLRNITEHCVLAVRGKPVVELKNQTTLVAEARREHSRKPEAFYRLVEALCPGSKLEMFARESRPGWTPWGAEVERFDD